MPQTIRTAAATAIALAASGLANAGALPAQSFTETFADDAANWQNGIFAPPTYVPSGSFDGSSYISTELDLASGGGFGLTVFRAQQDLGSSDGNFTGNYLASGIDTLSFQFRHDAAFPLGGFVRFAGPPNNPAIVWTFDAVPAGEWTEITLTLDPSLPNFIPAGGTFEGVLSNVGNLQFAVTGPPGTGGLVTFDIDQVSIIPSPAGLLAFAPLSLVAARRRRA